MGSCLGTYYFQRSAHLLAEINGVLYSVFIRLYLYIWTPVSMIEYIIARRSSVLTHFVYYPNIKQKVEKG